MRGGVALGLLLAAVLVAGLPGVRAQAPDDGEAFVANRLHLAGEYMREHRYEDALELYRQVYRTHPDHPKVQRGLKTCLLELKLYEELLLVLRTQLEESPGSPALLEELGTVHARMGDRAAAKQAWHRIIEVQRGSRGAYAMVADLMTRNRMLDEALAVYAEADSLHPGRFTRQKASLHELRFEFDQATEEYLTYLGQSPTALSYVEGRLLRIGEAEESLEPVIRRVERWHARQSRGTSPPRQTPDRRGRDILRAEDIVFRKLLGDLYLEAGDHDSAREQYFRLVDEAPQQASSLLVFGKRCQTDGEHEVAIRVFERIVDEFPDARAVPSALTEIAASQKELRRWDDALATYARLVAEYPETDFALAARFETGVVLREGKGQPAEAEQVFRALIGRREGPWSDAEPQMQVAECSLWQGDLERARGIYAAVRARPFPEPTLERALFEEARALFYSGTLVEADSLFKMVAQQYPRGAHVNDALQFSILINTNPDEPEVLGRYAEAELALRTSRPDDAVEMLSGLVADHPDAAIVDESLYLTGRAQRARGDSQRALAVLERAAAEAQVPDLAARARLLRAEIFADDLGDRAQALKEYEELLVAWPETLAADRARDRAAELTRMLP